jgi:hypothetical protein
MSAKLSLRAQYGSWAMAEDEFVERVEACRYPNDQFHHGDHIRLAWIYVRRYGSREAGERISATIKGFARSLGHEKKYHETLSRAWLRLVAVAQQATPKIILFDEFLAKHGWLLDRGALSAFYTGARLGTDAARSGWVEPDKRPLPCACAEGCLDRAAKAG